MPEYNKDLMIKVLKENHETKTNAEIAKILKTEHFKEFGNKLIDTLRKRISELRIDLGLGSPTKEHHESKKQDDHVGVVKIIDSDIEIEKSEWTRTQQELNKLRGNLARKSKDTQLHQEQIQWLEAKLGLAQDFLEHKIEKFKIEAKKNNSDSEAVAFIIGSDWHYEEKVDPETVNGLNKHTPEIARDKISKFFRNSTKLIQGQSRDVQINHGVLGLLGDHMSGYIHPELLEGNYMSPSQAVLDLHDIIVSGIDHILKNTKVKLTVVCKYGNHGRTTDKPRHSTAAENNFEWMMFKYLEKFYEKNDRVQFQVDKSYHSFLNLFGTYTIRFHHGDSVRFQGSGIGGVTIPASKAIGQWDKTSSGLIFKRDKSIIKLIDDGTEILTNQVYLDVFGHFHTQMTDTGSHKFVLNGSLIGYNAYAQKVVKAPYEEPKQAFFLLDRYRGKTISTAIDLLDYH